MSSRMKLNVVELSERPHNVTFKEAVLKSLGKLDGFEVLGSNVLVAGYIQPRKTAGGIIVPEGSVHEDRWQGKVGLILKMGEAAFKFDGAYEYRGRTPKVGEYVMYHTVDSRELGIHGVSCRLIDSSLIRMVAPDPDAFY